MVDDQIWLAIAIEIANCQPDRVVQSGGVRYRCLECAVAVAQKHIDRTAGHVSRQHQIGPAIAIEVPNGYDGRETSRWILDVRPKCSVSITKQYAYPPIARVRITVRNGQVRDSVAIEVADRNSPRE